MQDESRKEYDVAILGGGITGAAVLYVLSHYTNVKSIALVEKYEKLAQVNTNSKSNSQTLHFGDIETNYDFDKSKGVKEAAQMLAKYLENLSGSERKVFWKGSKMVLAVGDQESDLIEKRYHQFKKLFPALKKLEKADIESIEPELVRGRNPEEKILALYSTDGYTVDFGALAESFVNHAKDSGKEIDIFLRKEVEKIAKKDETYEITAVDLQINARVVVAAMGAHSLLFAKSLGYGKEFMILPVIGNFYCTTKKILSGKVYTVQKEKLPFAAVHGDPEVNRPDITRFGPTAEVFPILEIRNWKTFPDFIRSAGWDFKGIASIVKILSDKEIFNFVLQNFIYDLPIIGKRKFLETARKIAPKLRLDDIEFGRGLGGIRPQLVNKNTKKMLMGEAEIIGENIIFNITPSPGATASLKSAEKSAKKIIEFFGGKFHFDQEKFDKDFR